jgi:KRAB domain-containing zinc finger protein
MAENVTIEGLDESFHEILNENAPTDQNNNQQDEKSFICSICVKMLNTNSGHRRHKMGHSDSDQNKWECQICSKTFVDKGHFLGHVNKHIGNKPLSVQNASSSTLTKRHLEDM